LGGYDINNFVKKKLIQNGYREEFLYSSDEFIIRDIKENFFENEYILPDGKKIKLSKEINTSDEILFNPNLIGEKFDGIPNITQKIIEKCGVDIKKQMYKTIVCGGGAVKSKDFCKKLVKELRSLNQKFFEMETKLCENSELTAWKGGSILSGKSIFLINFRYKNRLVI
jgi:actin-related protein